MLVVLTAAMRINLDEGYEIIEFFAGQRRISRLASSMGLKACAHDVLYDGNASSLEHSALNINSDAGYVPGT